MLLDANIMGLCQMVSALDSRFFAIVQEPEWFRIQYIQDDRDVA